nr:T9SS type A sorting domain-containing protein [Saprospiraceae bacterium]
MKLIIFLTISILFFTIDLPTADAQVIGDEEFAPIGATWWYRTYAPICELHQNYFTLESKRDTIIDDRLARILEIDWNDRPDKYSTLVVHSHEEKVYFFEDEEFKLLYDFSLMPGDTLWHHLPKNRTSLDVGDTHDNENYPNPANSPFPFVLTSIDTVDLDGYLSRKFNYLPAGDFDLVMNEVVEPVGNLEALIAMVDIRLTSGCFGYLRCYSDHRFFHQFSSEGCTVSHLSEIPHSEFSLYPNPTTDHLIIRGLEEYSLNEYTIIDLQGRMVLEGTFTERIEVNHLPAGVYILTMNSSTHTARTKFSKF